MASQRKYRTYELQKRLPRLPVPELDRTIAKYLKSVEPLLTAEDLEKSRKVAEDFIKPGGVGRELQRRLENRARALAAETEYPNGSWIEYWWDAGAYLMCRDPLPYNNNYFGSVFTEQPHSRPLYIASLMCRHLQLHNLRLKREEIEPDFLDKKKRLPMCMFQYERYMQCTRIPGEVMDTLRVYHGSGHVIVIIQDQIFWVHVMHPDGTVLTTSELEYQLSRIERMATERSHRQTHYALPALTAENRGVWAELRQKLLQNPVNARNLDIVESCVCVLVLSDDEPQDSSDLMKKAFAGNGRNIWFDKSSIVVVHKNGKVGFNGEHAHADAPMPCRMLDLAVSSVIAEMKQGSDPLSPSAAALLDDPQPIDWELDEEMKASISTAVENVEKIINDTDVGAGEVMTFGREFLKQERLSPDSFVQMALQLAFLRDQGHITAVYESATTKQFYHARTETCRSLTNESKAFIEAMDNREISQHEKLNLMRNAIAAHKDYMKDAVFGQGVDRHLTGLYATAMESGIEIPQFFSDPGYVKSTTWELSTSNMTFSGRPGFPPPFDYSYGVCYGVHANSIVFAVTCRRSCKGKSASRFARQLELALLDMQRLTLSTHARL